MAIIRALLIGYSFVFEGLLALFLVGMSLVALLSGVNLKLDMLPFAPANTALWVLVLGLAGLLSVLLALRGKLRILFLAYSAAVFVFLFRGFFLGRYTFSSQQTFKNGIYLTLAALLGMFGAYFRLRRQRRDRR